MHCSKYEGKLNILNMHGCSNVLNCNDKSYFLLMADLFHSFHKAPHSGGLHLRKGFSCTAYCSKYKRKLNILSTHSCSYLLNCNDRSDFLLTADLFHSFHIVPQSGGLHLINANHKSEVSAVQCIVGSIREN